MMATCWYFETGLVKPRKTFTTSFDMDAAWGRRSYHKFGTGTTHPVVCKMMDHVFNRANDAKAIWWILEW